MLVSAKNIIQFSGGFRPSDKGGGEAVSKKKKKCSALISVWSKNNGGGPGPPLTPPLDPPLQLNPSRRVTLGVPTNGRSIEVPQVF